MKRITAITLAFVLFLSTTMMVFAEEASRGAYQEEFGSCTAVGNEEDSLMTTSDAGVEVIKAFEGFAKYPYYSGGIYQIGYGSFCDPDDYPDGITPEEAERLLRESLAKIEQKLNDFVEDFDLTLQQHQFDALASFTYNVGTAWLSQTGILRNAVTEGKSGNDFIFAISIWSHSGGTVLRGLVARRLVEAAMYLDGYYSTTIPDGYTYVMFDPCGGVVDYRVQGYDASQPDQVRATAHYTGYRFLGWYTQSVSGAWISDVDTRTQQLNLYAHWQLGEGNVDEHGNILGTEASYSRIMRSPQMVHESPDAESDVIAALDSGDVVTIVADYVTIDGTKWGKRPDGSWVNLTDTYMLILGDVDFNGNVDIFDANLIVAYYNGTAELNDDQLASADVNGDGEVDIFDANLIVAYYNGTLTEFPFA